MITVRGRRLWAVVPIHPRRIGHPVVSRCGNRADTRSAHIRNRGPAASATDDVARVICQPRRTGCLGREGGGKDLDLRLLTRWTVQRPQVVVVGWRADDGLATVAVNVATGAIGVDRDRAAEAAPRVRSHDNAPATTDDQGVT